MYVEDVFLLRSDDLGKGRFEFTERVKVPHFRPNVVPAFDSIREERILKSLGSTTKRM